MRPVFSGIACAAVLACGMVVLAEATQQPAQPPAQAGPQQPAAPAQAPAPAAEAAQMTLVGCVQREADYRQAKSAGRGGAAGTGAGLDNEFVLVNAAAASSASAGATPAPDAPAAGAAVGTTGAAGLAYELTGPAEGQLSQYVGRRVEIVGKAKAESAAGARPGVSAGGAASTTTGPATGAPAGAATGSASGRPAAQPGGADIMGQDLNLKEFEVVSVREATGSCAPIQR